MTYANTWSDVFKICRIGITMSTLLLYINCIIVVIIAQHDVDFCLQCSFKYHDSLTTTQEQTLKSLSC